MRVVAGEYKGRHLKAVPGDSTRPTTDKVKESMFNIIGPYFAGGSCLDMFAGSGGLAIEAVSRGIDHAFLSEKNRKAQDVIRTNIEITKEQDKFTVLAGDSRRNVVKLASQQDNLTFRLVFIDPPYQAEKTEEDILLLVKEGLVDDRTTFVCEMDKHTQLTDQIAGYQKIKRVEYGTIAIEIFEAL
ncbi:16S rRNA (guanine(966)-N(2))-methyltransferase RsmD [Jeotgalibaca sp. PTS2502]|uniref:16S rRNA (Guanine(966)-N(2))-methyltransferase RsmD n=1 Tax=Jeotgalibaca arthritidis TaxID=1868794 RepID=A0A6G7KBP9_9LACT|nr:MULTISPECIES: 16S rRNA (guanine(966)-N(2))-methyltransferase RsmD [Jeotgalibaca]APZ48996.1 16S rRNA (guanine(966)-N(2))-methyltransferase RsmD [Jeotgalibaca sp. PTS2502]QII82689.1 16S rRNA (guanine(966)-N(2))-methyltransferase RsmD [Jeotgalibaca arthritidis]